MGCSVLLVSMPWAQLEHPSIQLGLLRTILAKDGIRSRSFHFYLAFMEFLSTDPSFNTVTIHDYSQVATKSFIGDWIFSVPPFHDTSDLDSDFFAYLRKKGETEASLEKIILMRNAVPTFIEKSVKELLNYNPRVVGFTTTFAQNIPSLALSKRLKQLKPNVKIVFGGANCDGPMGAALHRVFPWIDVVVRGEGENIVGGLFKDLLREKNIRYWSGICIREKGNLVVNDTAPALRLNFPKLSPNYDDYFERLNRASFAEEISSLVRIPFESSRGCWWGEKHHCTFCGLNGSAMTFRRKNGTAVLSELIELASRYQRLHFFAVDNILELEFFKTLLPALKDSGYDFRLFYETKANITLDQVRLLKKSGVVEIQPGLESLSDSILQHMQKGTTALQNIRLLKWCAALGVRVHWNIIYGIPDEPIDEYDHMSNIVPNLVHLDPPSLVPLVLERFSPFFDHPENFGLEIIGPAEHYFYSYPTNRRDLFDIAYSFDYKYCDGRHPESYVSKLRSAVTNWQMHHENDSFGSLRCSKGPGFLLISDRRPTKQACDYQLSEIESSVYLACDQGATTRTILRKIKEKHNLVLTETEVTSFLMDLVEAGLVYHNKGHYLSLAVPNYMDAK